MEDAGAILEVPIEGGTRQAGLFADRAHGDALERLPVVKLKERFGERMARMGDGFGLRAA